MQSNIVPTDPNIRLGRKSGAEALTAAGFPTSEHTLATKASRGNGPAYRLFGRRAIYLWKDLLAWAEANTSVKCTTATEHYVRAEAEHD